MTWLVIVALAGGLGAFILRGRWHSRAQVAAVGATLAFGLAGYAVTGRPNLESSPERRIADDGIDAYETARPLLLATTGETGAWLTYADALGRGGDTLAAIRGLERALADDPRNPDLWIGLGDALVRHGERVGPAAELAFDHAATLAPNDPAPAFFHGQALLQGGDPAAALRVWATITPAPDAPWTPLLAADIAAARAMLR